MRTRSQALPQAETDSVGMTSPISSSTEFHDPELQTNVGDLVSQNAKVDLAGAGTEAAGDAPGQTATDTEVPMAATDTQTTMPASDTSAGAAMTGGFDPLRSDAAAADDGASTMDKVREALSQLPRNVGRTEQMVRLGAGTALIAGAIAAPVSKRWKIAMAALGAMEIATGATRYCPVWHAAGISTNTPVDGQQA